MQTLHFAFEISIIRSISVLINTYIHPDAKSGGVIIGGHPLILSRGGQPVPKVLFYTRYIKMNKTSYINMSMNLNVYLLLQGQGRRGYEISFMGK